mgnify:CR=1 FL=1
MTAPDDQGDTSHGGRRVAGEQGLLAGELPDFFPYAADVRL